MKHFYLFFTSMMVLLNFSCAAPGYQQGSNSLGFFIPILIIAVIVFLILSNKKKDDSDESLSSISNKDLLGCANKVVRLNFKGGIIGFLIDNPHKTLQQRILLENKNGWRVVQVIPDISGNLFVLLFRIILLVITLFLYTQSNGYFVIFEKISDKTGK